MVDSDTALTSGQAAKLCGVSSTTIHKWCKAGKMPYHKIPGSIDRRIMQSSVVKFLLDHGLPIPAELRRCVNDTSLVVAAPEWKQLAVWKEVGLKLASIRDKHLVDDIFGPKVSPLETEELLNLLREAEDLSS